MSGYKCCVLNCQSASSEKRGVKETLFRFPKDVERSTLWVLACNRHDLSLKKPTELYNNYKVCKLHFENKMFLNYEKTRLQPNAVPSNVRNNNEEEAGSSILNITKHFMDMQDMEHSEARCLTLNNTNVEEHKSNEIYNIEIDLLEKDTTHIEVRAKESPTMLNVGMQTGLSLSSKSPRKAKLQQRIKKYKKRIAVLESKLEQVQDCNVESIDSLDLLLDKYYPKQTADFLKMQARLFRKEAKDFRRSPQLETGATTTNVQ